MVEKKADNEVVMKSKENQAKAGQKAKTTPVKTPIEKKVAKEDVKPPVEEAKISETAKNEKINALEKEAKEKPKTKYIPYVKKENKSKSKEAREMQKKILKKKKKPVFRGRFGKKNIRRKSIKKWDKWRKPHGIDLDKGLQHGFRPKIGYRSQKEIRGIHPSGYIEIMVCNENDLAKINPKTNAARLSATMGKRKRNEIMKKANEKGIWVLN